MQRWLAWSLVALAFACNASAQVPQWAGDLTVFGTPFDERRPCLILSPSGARMRALCVQSDSCLYMKVSSDNGASWSVSSDTTFPASGLRMRGAADANYHYLLVCPEASSSRTLFRFEPVANSFRSAQIVTLAPDRDGVVLSLNVMSDVAFESADAYLNVGWVEQTAPGHRAICFAQSRDFAATFRPDVEVAPLDAADGSDAGVSLAATWQEDEEDLWIAAAVDRAGSIPEEIRLYHSTDQGDGWTQGNSLDASALSQTEPSLAGHGTTLLLAYSHAALPNARDVRLIYSLDGGETFAPPQTVAGSNADEHAPSIVIDNASGSFSLFYLSGDAGGDSAALMLYTGSLAAPWETGVVTAISHSAVASESPSVAGCALGTATLWCSRFVTGDCDVKFDAAWRGSSSPERDVLSPRPMDVNAIYPNPFNSTTTVILELSEPAPIELTICDPLGRIVRRIEGDILPAGEHRMALNLSDLPSGVYFMRCENSHFPVRRLLLVR